jgi:hypothetical protein
MGATLGTGYVCPERVIASRQFESMMGMLGTGDACPRMRREKVEARMSFMVDSSNNMYMVYVVYNESSCEERDQAARE